jgi:hypothetical protein
MPKPRYTLCQIEAMERPAWAWASSGHADESDFFYDGIVFWKLVPHGKQRAAFAQDLPQEGWWHRDECACLACRRGDASP